MKKLTPYFGVSFFYNLSAIVIRPLQNMMNLYLTC